LRSTGHRRHRLLIEERHRKFAQIEQSSVDTLALLQALQDPFRGLFRETAFAGASDNDGNDGHALLLAVRIMMAASILTAFAS
jgi:hypothetical protein